MARIFLALLFAALLTSVSCATSTNDTCLDSQPTGGPNGFNGIVFDIQVGSEDIVLKNLIIQVSSAWSGQRPAFVYLTRSSDSYAHNLNSLDDQWVKVAETMVGPSIGNAFVDLGLDLDHHFLARALQGVYIDLDDSLNLRYYHGIYEGQPIGADSHIELQTGRGIGHSLDSQFTPRQFSGAVCYEVVPPDDDCPHDGNLEVLLPPELDEYNTHLMLDGKNSDFKATIVVPKQYDSAKFSFSGAADDSGSFDSKDLISNLYWTIDNGSDPCNSIYIGLIPWNLFRTTLGGVTEERFSETVYYSTEIEIEVTKSILLRPETLLLLQAARVNQSGLIVTSNGTEIADFEHGDMPEGSPIPPYVSEPMLQQSNLLQTPNLLQTLQQQKILQTLQQPNLLQTLQQPNLLHTQQQPNVNLLQTHQQHSRVVRTRIPFEVAFDLNVKLWSNANVTANHLRVVAAVVDTSVLLVEPNSLPLAEARLEFVTVVPLPLYLKNSTIAVNDSDLDYDLEITEVLPERRCDVQQDFCTQHWRVSIHPEQCTLNGLFSATVLGACHLGAAAGGCIEPSPEAATALIEMDISSDDFCGVAQKVKVIGNLALHSATTECNARLHGRVTVSNVNNGGNGGGSAAINHTDIVMVRVEPTLHNSSFLTVFDEANSVSMLDYAITPLTHLADQVDFSFVWHGDMLRCDVEAHLEVFVRVEFEATRPLLMSVSSSGAELLSDEQTMHMLASASITISDLSPNPNTGDGDGADIDNGNSGDGGGNGVDNSSDVADANSSGGLSTPTLVAVTVALAIMLVGVIAGGIYFLRRTKASPVRAVSPPLSPVSRWTRVPMTFPENENPEVMLSERHVPSLSRVQATIRKAKLRRSRLPKAPGLPKSHLQTL